MKKAILCCSCLLLAAGHGYAQFEQAYITGSTDRVQSVITTAANTYLSAGNTSAPVIGATDAVLLHTTAAGALIGAVAYGGGQFDNFNSVREVPPGFGSMATYVALGSTSSWGFGNEDFYLVGVNAGGAPVFSRAFGTAAMDRGHCVQAVNDPVFGQGFISVGETAGFQNFFMGSNVYVVRTDQNGVHLASVVIGTNNDDYGYWIEQTADQGYIIVGATTRPACAASANKEIFVIKLNPNLGVVWNRIIGINPGAMADEDVAYCVKENPANGSLTITGGTKSFGAGNRDAFLLNLSPAGAFNFLNTYGGPNDEEGRSLLAVNTAAGTNYVVSGFTNSFGVAGMAGYVFQTTAAGGLLWTKVYDGPMDDLGYEITPNNVPGYTIAGESNSFSASMDMFLVETDLAGATFTMCESNPMQAVLNPPFCITSSAQFVMVAPNMAIPNNSVAFNPAINACAPAPPDVKLAAPSNTSTTQEISIYPNPASSSLTVTYGAGYSGGTLQIMDIQGKLVKEYAIENEDHTSMPINDLIPGMYFVKMTRPDGTMEYERFVKE